MFYSIVRNYLFHNNRANLIIVNNIRWSFISKSIIFNSVEESTIQCFVSGFLTTLSSMYDFTVGFTGVVLTEISFILRSWVIKFNPL